MSSGEHAWRDVSAAQTAALQVVRDALARNFSDQALRDDGADPEWHTTGKHGVLFDGQGAGAAPERTDAARATEDAARATEDAGAAAPEPPRQREIDVFEVTRLNSPATPTRVPGRRVTFIPLPVEEPSSRRRRRTG